MSARYGSKTRSGEAVSDLGRRPTGGAGGGGLNFYEEEFLAPGTWTWPGNTSFVEVLIVGGGGGGKHDATPPPGTRFHAGSGGGVGVFTVPVSAPVPVTVGAGGVAGTAPSPNGTSGGYSAFGTVTPPVPSFPVYLAIVNGGQGAGAPVPQVFYGGGTYSTSQTQQPQYGYMGGPTPSPTESAVGGGAGAKLQLGPTAFALMDRYGFGAGGVSGQQHRTLFQRGFYLTNGNPGNNFIGPTVVNNTGHGGSGMWVNPGLPTGVGVATDGSSGIVIVRWSE